MKSKRENIELLGYVLTVFLIMIIIAFSKKVFEIKENIILLSGVLAISLILSIMSLLCKKVRPKSKFWERLSRWTASIFFGLTGGCFWLFGNKLIEILSFSSKFLFNLINS